MTKHEELSNLLKRAGQGEDIDLEAAKFADKYYPQTAYLGNRKIYDVEGSEARREELIQTKAGAVSNAFIELEGLLNNAALSREYFKRSPGWLTQRINGNMVFNKRAMFRPDEYHQLAEAFRHIAKRLIAHADEIDAAAPDELDEE